MRGRIYALGQRTTENDILCKGIKNTLRTEGKKTKTKKNDDASRKLGTIAHLKVKQNKAKNLATTGRAAALWVSGKSLQRKCLAPDPVPTEKETVPSEREPRT